VETGFLSRCSGQALTLAVTVFSAFAALSANAQARPNAIARSTENQD
jgi:hypothetical protein